MSVPTASAGSSGSAKREAAWRLREARETAGMTLRELARVMTEEHGYRVNFAHLAHVEKAERGIHRDLLHAWASATGQADPAGWAEELVQILGEKRLGYPRQKILKMQFSPPPPAEVPVIPTSEELPSLLRSPEMVYARMTRLGPVREPAAGDAGKWVVTTRGPLARALRAVQEKQSIAAGPLVPGPDGGPPLVQLAAAPTPEERVLVVEQLLAASAGVLNPGLYEPLVTRSRSEFDIIARPGAEGAVVLGLPGGRWLWLSVLASDCPYLLEYLEPVLQEARDRRVIELVRTGPQMTGYWFGEWELVLLEHEKDAIERLFLQPHLGLLTLPPRLAARKGLQEVEQLWAAEGSGPTKRQKEAWLQQRAERIAIFRRKLYSGECRYRDIAAEEPLEEYAEDGYTHIRGMRPPGRDDDPNARLERLRVAHDHLSYLLNDLVLSEKANGYELRFVPLEQIRPNRQWSLLRKGDQQPGVLLTFTISDRARRGRGQWPPDDQGESFADAVVRDGEVAKRFQEEFEELWAEAEARGPNHTREVLQERINQIGKAIADTSR